MYAIRSYYDLHRYLRLLEATLIAVLDAFGLPGERVTGKTGVWIGGEKIASIGVGVRRWVSWHGFALNVGGDLSGFRITSYNVCYTKLLRMGHRAGEIGGEGDGCGVLTDIPRQLWRETLAGAGRPPELAEAEGFAVVV